MTSFVSIRPTLARHTQWALARDALHCQVALSSGRSLGWDRRRRPGGPRDRWTDQFRNVLRGHGRPSVEAFTTDAKIIRLTRRRVAFFFLTAAAQQIFDGDCNVGHWTSDPAGPCGLLLRVVFVVLFISLYRSFRLL